MDEDFYNQGRKLLASYRIVIGQHRRPEPDENILVPEIQENVLEPEPQPPPTKGWRFVNDDVRHA